MMAPEEAIVWLEDDIKEINRDLEDDKISNVYAEEGTEVYKMAISAIKRLKQYHEIGTVEECREAVKKRKGMQVNEIHVDEYFCPACGSENNNGDFGCPKDHYCPVCGQAIYW